MKAGVITKDVCPGSSFFLHQLPGALGVTLSGTLEQRLGNRQLMQKVAESSEETLLQLDS